jgi:hypothetical protein
MDRITRCPASAALPQIHDANPQPDRDKGKSMHGFLEAVIKHGREQALVQVDETHRAFCESIELAKMADRLTLSSEVALAYNWVDDTARRLFPLEHRAYEVDPACEIPLTVDLAGVGDSEVFVGDFKSGHGWLPEPHQSMQLGLGALALARLHEAHRAHVEYIRVRDDGSVRKFGAVLDVFALEGAADRVRGAMEDVAQLRVSVSAGATPNVTEGPWCRHCPAAQHCPAKTALIRHVMTDPQPIPYLLPLTAESALRAYQMLHAAKGAIAQIEGAIYAYAKTTPIPLGVEPDGTERWFGELSREGNDVLDGAVVHQVVTELYGGEAANKAVTMEATKAALSDVVRAHMPKDAKVTVEVKKALELVKARGGITNPITTSTREYTVAPDGATKVRKRKAG